MVKGPTGIFRGLLVLASVVVVLLIGYVDSVTLSEFGAALFYLVPVAWAAWFGNRTAGPLVAILAAATWYVSEVATSAYSTTWAPIWNSFTRLVFFMTASILMREYRAKRALAADLAESQRALSELNQDLEARVEERTSELLHLNRELESFSNSIAHDLRTPLRGIAGYSQLLLDEYADRLDESAVRYLRRVQTNTWHMGELIDALLTLSQLVRGEMSSEVVDLSAIAAEAAKELKAREPERLVVFDISPGLVVRGDPVLLRTLIAHLLENAWKFSMGVSPAAIRVGRNSGPEGAAYFVSDNGAGFDPEYSEKLFVPFQRLHSPGEFEGRGVGLATVERIVKRHGGTVWAEGAVGKGATFFFTLGPAATVPDNVNKAA
ncbi:MAG TPA: ATP-binding protein [Trueperaceae bacterium]